MSLSTSYCRIKSENLRTCQDFLFTHKLVACLIHCNKLLSLATICVPNMETRNKNTFREHF
jgi:hypothetical protein